MKNILLIIALCIVLISCEEIVDNPGLPYKEQLVIRAVLEPGKPVSDIRITRTLPPLDIYDEYKALITDANAIIEYNGTEYKLDFSNSSGTYYNNSLVPVVGGTYRLRVEKGSMKATAETTVPDSVVIESFFINFYEVDNRFGDNFLNFNFFVNFKPVNNAVYTAKYYFNFNDYPNYQENIYRNDDTLKNGEISYLIQNLSYDLNTETPDTNDIKNSISKNSCAIISWDPAFFNYFITRYEGNSDNDFFGTSGTNIKGNLSGGLGMFIGKTTTNNNQVKFVNSTLGQKS
jgi:hypothetical protein